MLARRNYSEGGSECVNECLPGLKLQKMSKELASCLTVDVLWIDVDLVKKVFCYCFKLPDFFGIQAVVGS